MSSSTRVVTNKWASQHEVNDVSLGILNSYSLNGFAILPNLPETISPKNYAETFSTSIHLNLVHNVPIYLTKKESSLGDVLLGFFKCYVLEIDWNTQISICEAKVI